MRRLFYIFNLLANIKNVILAYYNGYKIGIFVLVL